MDSVRIEIEDAVATVTLDRPPVNALDAPTFREIRDAFRGFGDRTDVRVVILTATGERAFCAGVDLQDSARRRRRELGEGDTIADVLDPGIVPRECFFAVADCAVPVIGAINGAAVGAGLGLAASCDIIYASENARFALTEVNVGVLGGGRHLQRMVGPYKARKMFFTGEFVPADEFYRLGAIEAVVPGPELLPTARALATEIASKSPVGVRLAKQSLNRVEDLPLKPGYQLEQDYTIRVTGFNDSAEAREAWRDKRSPEWTWT